MNKRYIVTDIRDQKDNEFIFGCSERIVASTEFTRLLRYFNDHGFTFNDMDERTLSTDNNGNRLHGYRITYKGNNEEKF